MITVRYFFLSLFAFLGLSSAVLAASENTGLGEGMVNPGYEEKPDWFKLSFLDLREDVEEAKAAGKRVMLYFYQDGCPYCAKLLQDNFGQREIAEKTQEHFDVIAINMWGNREVTDMAGKVVTEKDFAANRRVMFTPTLLFLDEQGEVALRVNGYYFPGKFDAALDYVAAKKEQEVSFGEYYAKLNREPSQAELHTDDRFLKPPYDLTAEARGSGKPVVVLFEQKHCRACDELHQDILQRPRSGEELSKVDAVQLDQWADTPVVTPAGEQTTARKWAKALDVKHAPTLVFFDAQGKEVFRTEAYLKAFHIQGAMHYVHSGAYQEQPNFQRFLQTRREEIEKEEGKKVDLWQ